LEGQRRVTRKMEEKGERKKKELLRRVETGEEFMVYLTTLSAAQTA
jgi:hypothetical protein